MSAGRQTVASATLKIGNRLGLHARAASLLVETARVFDADVWITKDGETVNGKSIMEVMMLAAAKGSSIHVETHGPAAEEALKAIRELVESRFREDS